MTLPAILLSTAAFAALAVGSATSLPTANVPASNSADEKAPMPSPPEFTPDDPVAYGLQIATHADAVAAGWTDEVMQGTMTLYDSDGDSVRRKFSRMALEQPEEGDRLIIKFLSPAEIKGVSALTHENVGGSDDNWLYLPANKRVRRISGANNTASFQGTEFTYEDLANLDPREFEWRFYEETTLDREGVSTPVFKLEAKPTYDDTGYARLVVYYHRENFRQERVEYYDLAGKHLKTRNSGDWQHTHDRFWRQFMIDMENHQTGKRTTLKVERQFLDLSRYTSKKTGKARTNLKADQFTTRALEG
jgi:hypothetical protein